MDSFGGAALTSTFLLRLTFGGVSLEGSSGMSSKRPPAVAVASLLSSSLLLSSSSLFLLMLSSLAESPMSDASNASFDGGGGAVGSVDINYCSYVSLSLLSVH